MSHAIAPISRALPISSQGEVAPGTSLRAAFDQTVGGLFYSELIKSLRKTVGEPAYLHGGQAEKMFQSQLDQQLVEQLASRGASFTGPLYDRFLAGRTAPDLGLTAGLAAPADSAALQREPHQLAQAVQAAGQVDSAGLLRLTQQSSQFAAGATDAAVIGHLIRK